MKLFTAILIAALLTGCATAKLTKAEIEEIREQREEIRSHRH